MRERDAADFLFALLVHAFHSILLRAGCAKEIESIQRAPGVLACSCVSMAQRIRRSEPPTERLKALTGSQPKI